MGGEDCFNHKERILELIQRTNQLNFTKKNISETELIQLLENTCIETKYISVYDDFGNYGIVGFYALNLENNSLLHFLFSCRILGFGVESYIYQKLGKPEINIIGNVSASLEEPVDWITEENETQDILMIGGCDLRGMSSYLEKFNIVEEFSEKGSTSEGIVFNIRTSDTYKLLNSMLPIKEKDFIVNNIPTYDPKKSLKTKIFTKNYNMIVWSVVDDYVAAIFRHKTKDYKISSGNYFDTEYLKTFEKRKLNILEKEFIYEGKETPEEFENNLKRIISKIDSNIKIVLINGIEVDVSDWIGEERCNRNKEMNACVDKVIKEFPNVTLLDMRNIVTTRESLNALVKDNRHFTREVYYKMAQRLLEILHEQQLDINMKLDNKSIENARVAAYYDALLKWVKGFINKKRLSDILLKDNYKNVAIYGMGRLGEVLFDDLVKSNINIIQIIDNKRDEYKGIICCNNLDSIMFECIDIIIVTPIFDYDEIVNEIKKRKECNIISLENLLNRL